MRVLGIGMLEGRSFFGHQSFLPAVDFFAQELIQTAKLYELERNAGALAKKERNRTFVDSFYDAIYLSHKATAKHLFRSGELLITLAKILGLPSETAEIFGISHDFGKLPVILVSEGHFDGDNGIRINVLDAGKLTTEQFKTFIPIHTELGWRMTLQLAMVRNNLSPKIAEDIQGICYQHHKRLDGSGYPDEIKRGDALNPFAKVVAVIDSFLARIDPDRPYKDGEDRSLYGAKHDPLLLSPEKYDQEIVRALFNLPEAKIMEIQDPVYFEQAMKKREPIPPPFGLTIDALKEMAYRASERAARMNAFHN